MKLYHGYRGPGGVSVYVRTQSGGFAREVPLARRLDLRNHSPSGFEWGYGGSGPAQLSLAILADYFGDDDRAQRLYQDFKFAVVANLPHAAWELTGEQIDQAILKIESALPMPEEVEFPW